MPRKKTDPIDDILTYATNAPLAGADVVFKLCATILRNRHLKDDPPVEKVRRRRTVKPVVSKPVFPQGREFVLTVPTPDSEVAHIVANAKERKIRKRRMRADSPPPPSTATPIVPPVEAVDDEDGGETYSEA